MPLVLQLPHVFKVLIVFKLSYFTKKSKLKMGITPKLQLSEFYWDLMVYKIFFNYFGNSFRTCFMIEIDARLVNSVTDNN